MCLTMQGYIILTLSTAQQYYDVYVLSPCFTQRLNLFKIFYFIIVILTLRHFTVVHN